MANKYTIENVFKAVDKVSAPISKMQNRIMKFTNSIGRGFSKANRFVDKLTGKLKNIAKSGALVLAGAMTAIGLAIEKTAERADVLAKTARTINMPIEDLQKFQFIAEQSGISSDSLTKSLGILDKQIGQAKTGTGTLVTMLKKSNPVLLRQLAAAKNTSEAFTLMNKAIKNTKNPTDRAALAFAAYGRQGLAMTNVANLSSKQLKALSKEAEKNGIITEKQAQMAEAFDDQLNSLKHTMQGVLQEAILPMLPTLQEYLRLTQDWIMNNKALINTDIKEIIMGVGNSIAFLVKHGKTIGEVVVALIALSLAIKTINAIMIITNVIMAANPIGVIIAGVALLTAGIILLIKYWDKLKTALENTKVFKMFSKFSGGIKSFFGVKDDTDKKDTATTASVVSPQARVSKAFSESKTTAKTEVTIKDDTGKAKVTKGSLGGGLKLQKSGAF